MYVLCTLAVFTLHSLFKSWNSKALEAARSSEEAVEQEGHGRPEDGGLPEVWPRTGGDGPLKSVDQGRLKRCRAEGKRRRGGSLHNVPNNGKQVQVR